MKVPGAWSLICLASASDATFCWNVLVNPTIRGRWARTLAKHSARKSSTSPRALTILAMRRSEVVNESPAEVPPADSLSGESGGVILAVARGYLRRVSSIAGGAVELIEAGFHGIGLFLALAQAVCKAVCTARRDRLRIMLCAMANHSRTARALHDPRTSRRCSPRLRAMALTHSTLAARAL